MEPTVTPQVSDQGNGSIDGSKKRSEAETSSAADAIDQQIKRSKLVPNGNQTGNNSVSSVSAPFPPVGTQVLDTTGDSATSPLKRKADEIVNRAAQPTPPSSASTLSTADARAEERRRLREIQERERKEKEEAKKKREEDKKKREEEKKRKEEEKAKRDEEKRKKEAEKAEEKKRKEEEKKKKEEEKQQKEKEREESKRKKEEEKKRKEDEKAKKAEGKSSLAVASATTTTATVAIDESTKPAPPSAMAKSRMFMEMFVKKKAAAEEKKQLTPEELIKEEYTKYSHPANLFRSFVPDKNMRMAPITRSAASHNTDWIQSLCQPPSHDVELSAWRATWKAHRGPRKRAARSWATLLPKDVRKSLSSTRMKKQKETREREETQKEKTKSTRDTEEASGFVKSFHD